MIDILNGLQIGTSASELGKLSKGVEVGQDQIQGMSSFQDLLSSLGSVDSTNPETIKNLVQQEGALQDMLAVTTEDKDAATLLSDKLLSDTSISENGEIVETLVGEQAENSSSLSLILGQEAGPKLAIPQNSEITNLEKEVISKKSTVAIDELTISKNSKTSLSNISKPEQIEKIGKIGKIEKIEKIEKPNEKIDLRLGGFFPLSKKNGKLEKSKFQEQSNLNKLLSSEEFVTNHKTGLNSRPQAIGKQVALQAFSKEKSVLDKSGIIKRSKISLVGAKTTDLGMNSKELLTSKLDEVLSAKSEILTPNVNGQNLATVTSVAASVENSANTNVLDLSSVDNPQKLISEISNYIENSRIQGSKELNMIVKHNDLGQFEVNVVKSSNNMIDLQINTMSDEGHSFFQKNEVNLLKTLNSQGISVSDFKLTSSNSSSMNSSGNDSSAQNFSGNQQGFTGKFNGSNLSQDSGRQRRNELWDQYREQMGA